MDARPAGKRRWRVVCASVAPPSPCGDGSYADEFGKRHPKGYLLIDHTGIQWRLPYGRIRTVQLIRRGER